MLACWRYLPGLCSESPETEQVCRSPEFKVFWTQSECHAKQDSYPVTALGEEALSPELQLSRGCCGATPVLMTRGHACEVISCQAEAPTDDPGWEHEHPMPQIGHACPFSTGMEFQCGGGTWARTVCLLSFTRHFLQVLRSSVRWRSQSLGR